VKRRKIAAMISASRYSRATERCMAA